MPRFVLIAFCVAALGLVAPLAAQQPPKGTVQAVYDLLDRVLPGSKDHFTLSFNTGTCPGIVEAPCYAVSDATDGGIAITASTASELASGIGFYFREYCNMTIGWKRGGGSNIFIPKTWPKVGSTISKRRVVPFSYAMNVCTHSYSLAWYSWEDWQVFIDWMALSGLNLVLAMTGQEEVQYKVFQHFGLNDTQIRTWFNGPAFLTWSRGQNEYGNDIAGELPRSWMQSQWALQKQILQRERSLGIIGQLPGFQGNVPLALKEIHGDANITKQGDTGWMYSTDPLYAEIADYWMKTLIADFGTDHWYQLDGYFNGGTAPWLEGEDVFDAVPADAPACTWSDKQPKTYLAGCEQACKVVSTLAAAQAACAADLGCGGITSHSTVPDAWELRAGNKPDTSPGDEVSYYITNAAACHPPAPIGDDPGWVERGVAAYTGLNRTDPDAIWSFQGWAFVGWSSNKQGSSIKSFVDATPKGKFVVIDMSVNGEGEWKKWNNAAFFGAHFIWTTLHDFGGTDGLKGDLAHINEIPFAAMKPEADTNVWGTGFTPEGIDQNPVYYEFMLDANYRTERVANITDHVIVRSHRRYGLTEYNDDVAQAWSMLVASAYAQDLSVQDSSGVPHFPGGASQFNSDRRTPTATLCTIYNAWGKMIDAASAVDPKLETFRYDLVNTGRELLAQLATPVSMNFSDAVGRSPLNAAELKVTGNLYVELLDDVDTLVGADQAFLVGPWIEMARYFGANATDCVADGFPTVKTCPDFYEWNARVQLTTWNPTKSTDKSIPGGPIDYASKHWNGLIGDYYKARAHRTLSLALQKAAAKTTVSKDDINQLRATLAYQWTTATNKYPTEPVGDALALSKQMHAKYAPYYASC